MDNKADKIKSALISAQQPKYRKHKYRYGTTVNPILKLQQTLTLPLS